MALVRISLECGTHKHFSRQCAQIQIVIMYVILCAYVSDLHCACVCVFSRSCICDALNLPYSIRVFPLYYMIICVDSAVRVSCRLNQSLVCTLLIFTERNGSIVMQTQHNTCGMAGTYGRARNRAQFHVNLCKWI